MAADSSERYALLPEYIDRYPELADCIPTQRNGGPKTRRPTNDNRAAR
jgi:hypothetical protein